MSVADELVARFDAAGNLVGACRRSIMRRDNAWHAASLIVVRGPGEDVYLHRRTLSKDVFPGLLDFAAGGVLLAGEDPVVGARRELDEELGVHGVDLVPLGVVTYADEHTRYHAHRFTTTWSGLIRWQPEEVAWGDWVPLPELVRRIDREPGSFVPDSVAVWLPVLRRWSTDGGELG